MANGLRLSAEQLAEYLQRTGKPNPLPGAARARGEKSETATRTDAHQPTRKTKRHTDRDKAVSLFLQQIALLGIPEPVREYRFHDTRRWRFDFAWPDLMLAAEYEGGIYTDGAHTRGAHYESDCEKYNEAGLLGWLVLRFTVNLVKSGLAADQVTRRFEGAEQ